MSADLHIHAMVGVTEDDLRCFFANTLGSKWCTFPFGRGRCSERTSCPHWKAVADSPDVWVGEVSWLKAMLTDDSGYIPEPVEAVHDLIGEELPVLDEALREAILRALTIPNERAQQYDTTEDEAIAKWLDDQMGQRLFTVSW